MSVLSRSLCTHTYILVACICVYHPLSWVSTSPRLTTGHGNVPDQGVHRYLPQVCTYVIVFPGVKKELIMLLGVTNPASTDVVSLTLIIEPRYLNFDISPTPVRNGPMPFHQSAMGLCHSINPQWAYAIQGYHICLRFIDFQNQGIFPSLHTP